MRKLIFTFAMFLSCLGAMAYIEGDDVTQAVTKSEWTVRSGTYQELYPERYTDDGFAAGDILSMTVTGMESEGYYEVEFYAAANMAWKNYATGAGIAKWYVNDVEEDMYVVGQTSCDPSLYVHRALVYVEQGGDIKLGIKNVKAGGNWYVASLKAIYYRGSRPTADNPHIVNGALQNPEFEAGGINGWTNSGTVDMGFLTSAPPNNPKNSAAFVEKWGASGSIDFHQSTKTLPAGTYRISVRARNEATTPVYLYANDSQVAFTQNKTDRYYTDVTLSRAGTINVGVRCDNHPGNTWFALDDFQVECLGLMSNSEVKEYVVGEAVSSHSYVQPGALVTISYPLAYTDDPDAEFAIKTTGITWDGSALAVTPTASGFTFVVPQSSAGSVHSLQIDANSVGYDVANVYNAQQQMQFTIAALQDGVYYLQNEAGQFLTRGLDWGTRACVDRYGLPIRINTGADGFSTIQFADNNFYLFNDGNSENAYCDSDKASAKNTHWTFTLSDGVYRLSSAIHPDQFVGMDAGNARIFTDKSTATAWTVVSPAEHQSMMAALRADVMRLSAEAALKQGHKTYVEMNPSTTAEQFQGDGNIFQKSIDVYPGIYCFSIQGFSRMASNAVTQDLHTLQADCPPVVFYFGDVELPMASVYDFQSDSNVGADNQYNGHYYPNGQGGALTRFKENGYANTLCIRVDEATTLQYGIRNLGKVGANAHWTCYSPEGVQVVRYFDPETEGLDPEDLIQQQLPSALVYACEDYDANGSVSISDVTEAVKTLEESSEAETTALAAIQGIVDVILEKKEATQVLPTLDVTIYAQQTAEENARGAQYTLDRAIDTKTGESLNHSFDLTSCLTTVRVKTTLPNVVAVSIHSVDGTPIAGPMQLECTASNAVTITYPQGEESAITYTRYAQSDVLEVVGDNAGTYTAYLLPTYLRKGVLVTVRTNDGKSYSQKFAILPLKENELTFTSTIPSNLWMATIPGNVYFSQLSTPGAHDAATSGCTSYTYLSKCQSDDLQTLLANGVRMFDLRPGYMYTKTITADNLYIYHGEVNTNVLYRDAIKTLVDFLKENPSEAITIVQVKENNKPNVGGSSYTDHSSEMWNVINALQNEYADYFLNEDHSYYTLSDLRGKIMFLNRNATATARGFMISSWPDNGMITDYSSKIANTCKLSLQDKYNDSESQKKTDVSTLLKLASENTDRANYHINYTSIAGSLTSNLTDHAAVMNPYTTTALQSISGPTGYILSDYMGSEDNGGAALLKAIIEQNRKYVFMSRTRVGQ